MHASNVLQLNLPANDSAPALEHITADDLCRDGYAPPRFLVENLLPENQIAVMAGESGARKSAFVLHLCASILTGQPVGGTFETAPEDRPILYCNAEMSREQLQFYLARTFSGAPEARKRLIFPGRGGFAGFEIFRGGQVATGELEAYLDAFRPCLVVLDSIRGLTPTMKENETDHVRPLFLSLAALRETYQCGFLLCHHFRKLGNHNTPRERMGGSAEFLNAADVALALSRPPKARLDVMKTRTPMDGYGNGTQYRLQSGEEVIDGGERRFWFEFSPLTAQEQSLDACAEEIINELWGEGAKTQKELQAESGPRKKAFIMLRDEQERIMPAPIPERARNNRRGRKPAYWDVAERLVEAD